MPGQTDMSTDQEHTLPLLLYLNVSDRWNRQFLSFPKPKWWADRRVSECFFAAESPKCCFSPWRSLRECFHEKQHCKVWSLSQISIVIARTLLVCRTVFGSDFVSVTKFCPTLISYSLCVFLLCRKQEVFDHFLFRKLVVSFHYRNCYLIWSIKRILRKCLQDQSCSFLSEQKVFCNDQRIEMIIFLLKLSVFLTCFFHNNEWRFFRKAAKRKTSTDCLCDWQLISPM